MAIMRHYVELCPAPPLCAVKLKRTPVCRATDYVTRYAKKEDAMPKRGMMDGSASEACSEGKEGDGYLSSSEDDDDDQAAGHLDR